MSDYTFSGPATQELSLEGNEGIYNSSLDWLPISYNREAIYLLDLGTCYILEMGGV